MSWLRSSSCLSVCLLAAAPLLAEDAALPAYVPPGARLLIGLRVRNFSDALAAQGIDLEAQARASGLLAQSPFGGLDPFHGVDEILVASAGVGQNPPTLVVMTGRFDAATFSAGKAYRGALILETKGTSRQATAFVDANTMLEGPLPLVEAAIDGGKGAPIDQELAARAAELRARYDIWGAGTPPAGAELPAGAEPLEAIDRFSFGMSFSHGLECVADLHARSAKDLAKLNSSLQLLEAMLKAQPADASQGRFDLRTENGGIHVSLSVPEEALKKAIATQRASLVSAMASQLAAPATPLRTGPPGKTEVVKDAAGNTIFVRLPGNE